jgi:hypothetical protein
MKHVAALLLAQLGGNANPTEADVKKILSSGERDVAGGGQGGSNRGAAFANAWTMQPGHALNPAATWTACPASQQPRHSGR